MQKVATAYLIILLLAGMIFVAMIDIKYLAFLLGGSLFFASFMWAMLTVLFGNVYKSR